VDRLLLDLEDQRVGELGARLRPARGLARRVVLAQPRAEPVLELKAQEILFLAGDLHEPERHVVHVEIDPAGKEVRVEHLAVGVEHREGERRRPLRRALDAAVLN
jgi:hypothetical protein